MSPLETKTPYREGLPSDSRSALLMAAHRVEPSTNMVTIYGHKGMRAKHYDALQHYNFAKDGHAALRFRYEEAKHRYKEALLSGSDQLTSIILKYEKAETRWKLLKDRTNQAKSEFDDVDSLLSIYENIMAKYRPDQIRHKPLP